MLPSLKRVAVLANPLDPFTRPLLEQVHLAGRNTGIEIAPIAMARGSDELEAAFAAMSQERAEAVVVQGIFFSKAVADLAVKHRLPSASVLRQFAQAGGLISYGADVSDIFRRSAVLVHKILQGTKPSDLPVELPTKFELVVNLKTAKALGLDVPSTLLAARRRGDRMRTARVHHAARRCGGGVAACGAGAAPEQPHRAHRLPGSIEPIGVGPSSDRAVQAGLGRERPSRGSRCHG